MPKTSLVKIIPKPKPKVPGWVSSLLWVALVLLVFIMILFFSFQGEVSSLEERKEDIRGQISEAEAQAREVGEQEIIILAEKIKHFFRLLGEHKFTSQFFEFLRVVCHPRVQFSSLDLYIEDYRIALSGKTESFQTLGEQLLSLQTNENIQELKVSNISLDQEGRVLFRLNLFLTETVLKRLVREGEAEPKPER